MEAPQYHFPQAALDRLKAKREEIVSAVKRKLITVEQGSKVHIDFMVELIRESRTQGDPDGSIVLQCPACSRTHIIPRDVKMYECKCSRGVERPTFIGRVA